MQAKQHATEQLLVNWEIKGVIKKYLKTNKNENVAYLNLWDEQKNEREIYKNTDLPQDTRVLSTNNLILYLKEVEKEEDTAQIQ